MAGKMKTKMIKKEKHFEESETMNKGEKKYFKETAINIFRETKKKDI